MSRIALNAVETDIPIHSEGRTYGFLLTGLPEEVEVVIQFRDGNGWHPYPDIDYTRQSGNVIRGKFFVVVQEMRVVLVGGTVAPDTVLMSLAEGITSTW